MLYNILSLSLSSPCEGGGGGANSSLLIPVSSFVIKKKAAGGQDDATNAKSSLERVKGEMQSILPQYEVSLLVCEKG
jgi:hypothetical protein